MAKKSRAEIQRQYRQRRDADPDRRRQYVNKEREKYIKDLHMGKRKRVADINCERELRKLRREWRGRQRNCRTRDRIEINPQQPTSSATPLSSTMPPGSHESRQRTRGRKIRRRDKTSSYRRIQQLEVELAKAKRDAEKHKKRFQRVKSANKVTPSMLDTPRTKTRKLLSNFHRYKESVKKTLVFHYALVDQIKNRYQETRGERQKRTFARLLSGRIIQRYRLQKVTKDEFGFSARRWAKDDAAADIFQQSRKKRCHAKRCQLMHNVVGFYTRDDVSRATAGKNDTVTRHKSKMQKRLLLDTLNNIYLKFRSEFPMCEISYSMFCRLRPFWVVPPSSSDRDTCLCKVHDNLQLMLDKMVDLHVLEHVSVERLCEALVCDSANVDCMYGKCTQCAGREIEFLCDHEFNSECVCCVSCLPKLRPFKRDETVSYFCWKTKMEVLNDGKRSSTVVKEMETVQLGTLVETFTDLLSKAKRHIFNIRHQYLQYRCLRSQLDDSSCLLHIDFAENYLCQYHREIQSVHFGGSHHQTTMHTGVLYVGQFEPKPFCTLSDSRLHEPVAIWVYLAPVLKSLLASHPTVKNIHVFSDGPTTQYREKRNFFLFSTKLFEYGFNMASWNFFEASHGKGAADGVGAVLKRTADRLVKQGTDLPSPQEVFAKLQGITNVELHFVDSDAVNNAVDVFNSTHVDLQPVPGTMTLHQLYADSSAPGRLLYRELSCFCQGISKLCPCFDPKTFHFRVPENDDATRTSVVSSTSCIEAGTSDVQLTSVTSGSVEPTASLPTDAVVQTSLRPIISSDDLDLVGLYCVVKYNNKAYPGKILAVNETDLTVECMHCIGTKYDRNRFFWPDKVKDVCMYEYSEILSLIPELERLADRGRAYTHFRVNPLLCSKIETLLK